MAIEIFQVLPLETNGKGQEMCFLLWVSDGYASIWCWFVKMTMVREQIGKNSAKLKAISSVVII